MNLEPLARKLAAGEGQDFDALPVDMADLKDGKFPGRDRGEPFKIDYLAAAEMQRAEGRTP